MRIAGTIPLLACALLLGCDPVAEEGVTLQLGTAATPTAKSNAVAIITKILTTKGWTPLKHSTHTEASMVGGYAGEGKLGAFIYNDSGQVQVLFREMGRFRSRPEAIEARDAIRRELIEAFGKEKVKE